ncbi:dTMP kinase [Merismopedia glauca]|uniref:Thymidylate kinase n=1 Tax=Merismopedia glauca CCAP 1448/3 TaxID=1296344 RepID=A0A2T1C343_9CYAN|nr:dTMP kinase [Merismopedia glauca]PSB02690.1 dTMP kinase [Merismopedia glauca CCAP 1448/3]
MKGKLIVFEGVEGCGKTTQIEQTRQWLEDLAISVAVTRQPGGTQLGQELRQILLHSQGYSIDPKAELLLYAADRAQHLAEVIKPELEKGTIVLCDRYTDSTIAYQGYGRGLDLAAIETLNRLATGGLEPYLTLWLDIDVEIGLNRVKVRGESDRLEQDTIDFHRLVQQGYQKLALHHPQIIHRVDASLSLEAVQLQIRSLLASHLNL